MSYAEDENYDGYDLEVDAENDSLQHALTDAIKELAEAKAEVVRLKGEAESWEKVFDRTCELLADVKEQLRLCNVDQFTTAAELAEATVKNSLTVQRPWVGLTAEDMADAHNSTSGDVMMRLAGFARAIEAKLREKNGG